MMYPFRFLTPTVYRYLAWAATLAIFIGCSWPGEGVAEVFSSRDKLVHVSVFAVFGALWRLSGYTWRTVLGWGLVYGALIEVWQAVMPINRSGDVWDVVADTLGTAIGILLAAAFQRWIVAGSKK